MAAKAYVPELDGMRAVSIMIVMLSHFGVQAAPALLGVTVFFVISGYLITGQLLSEIKRTGELSLPLFYIRRVLRLYPALLIVVSVSVLAAFLAGSPIPKLDSAAALFYFVNILEVFRLLNHITPNVPSPFSPLWSLAVEEHYYLFFPFLILLFGRRDFKLVCVLSLLIILVTTWRVRMAGICSSGCTLLRIEHGTDTRIDSILYGALLATLLESGWRASVMRVICKPSAAVVGAVMVLGALLIRDPWFRETFRFSAEGIGLCFLFGAILYGPAFAAVRAVLGHRVMTLVGRWSYSLYLWNWLVLCLAMALLPSWATAPLLGRSPSVSWVILVFAPLMSISFLMACASYYGIERPMLRARRAFGSHAMSDASISRPERRSLPERLALRLRWKFVSSSD